MKNQNTSKLKIKSGMSVQLSMHLFLSTPVSPRQAYSLFHAGSLSWKNLEVKSHFCFVKHIVVILDH